MRAFLLATDSVHATAAGCDYLDDRLDPGDSVIALAVVEPADDTGARDVADALNVAEVRLPGQVETEQREGDPGETLLAAATEHCVDEIVLVSHGSPGGSTIRAILSEAGLPVVVVPPAC